MGVLSHLGQSVNRNNWNFGYRVRYDEDAPFQHKLKTLLSLALFPGDMIISTFVEMEVELRERLEFGLFRTNNTRGRLTQQFQYYG